VPTPHAGSHPYDLHVLMLVGDDLVEQREHRAAATIHDRNAADLQHVEFWQDRPHRRLGAGDHLLVDQRLAHQPGDHVLRSGAARRRVIAVGRHACSPAAALGAAL